ncbi:MAG: hypothetical protein VX527_01910 [Planctomycetota bacterium]|nr:hypothetical protein [Planctomycetota bacterium]
MKILEIVLWFLSAIGICVVAAKIMAMVADRILRVTGAETDEEATVDGRPAWWPLWWWETRVDVMIIVLVIIMVVVNIWVL